MKNIIILAMVFFLYALGYAWKTYEPKEVQKSTIALEKNTHKKIEISKSTIEEPIKEEETISPFEMLETGEEHIENTPELHTLSPFIEEDLDDTKLTMKSMEGVEPISAIRLDKDLIQKAQVGDTITLPSIDGIEYELEITHRTLSNNGNISLNGIFSENGISYNSIITEGVNSTFISFSAPTGNYEVALSDGLGYMYLSADIENSRIDYSKSDVIEHIALTKEEE